MVDTGHRNQVGDMRLLLSKRAIMTRLVGLAMLTAALGWLLDLTSEFLLVLRPV